MWIYCSQAREEPCWWENCAGGVTHRSSSSPSCYSDARVCDQLYTASCLYLCFTFWWHLQDTYCYVLVLYFATSMKLLLSWFILVENEVIYVKSKLFGMCLTCYPDFLWCCESNSECLSSPSVIWIGCSSSCKRRLWSTAFWTVELFLQAYHSV